MRFLAFHVEKFRSEITEKGRARFVEPPEPAVTEVSEALVILVSVEKEDEAAPEQVAEAATSEIAGLAAQLGTTTVLLHPFAHLFAELAAPPVAVRVLDLTRDALVKRGLHAERTPFGWFNTLEIKAKGHPLSRVARRITPRT